VRRKKEVLQRKLIRDQKQHAINKKRMKDKIEEIHHDYDKLRIKYGVTDKRNDLLVGEAA
jgi:hypothetical protein